MFVDVVLPFSLQIEFDSWFLWKERAVAPGVFEIDEVLFKKLRPEKENAISKHENIISSLNQRMSEKASCQIKLNETRDTLAETNQVVSMILI